MPNKVQTVVIVGAGPAGLFYAYKLALKASENPGLKIIVLDRGKPSSKRVCPNMDCRICAFAERCAILCGEGGAGGYSDGKVTLSTGRGVQCGPDLNFQQFEEYLSKVDTIFTFFGPESVHYDPIAPPACLTGTLFSFESYPLRFFGTGGIRVAMNSIREYLETHCGVEFRWETDVQDILQLPSGQILLYTNYGVLPTTEDLVADHLVLATGSYNWSRMETFAERLGVPLDLEGPAGIGIRLETDQQILEPLMSQFYDYKLYLEEKFRGQFIQLRSFCVNRGGSITNEVRTNKGSYVVSINGRSEDKGTGRSNMAVIAKISDGKLLIRELAAVANRVTGGLPLRQSALQFVRRSDLVYMESYTKNSRYAAIPSHMPEDLWVCFRSYLLEFEKAVPGSVTHPNSLVYYPEIKYHMPRWPLSEGFFVDGVNNVQMIGNAAGYTDSISTAATIGLVAAEAFQL